MKRNIIFFIAGLLAATLGIAAAGGLQLLPGNLAETQVKTVVTPDPTLTASILGPSETTTKPGAVVPYFIRLTNPSPDPVAVIGSALQSLNGKVEAYPWSFSFSPDPATIGAGQTVTVTYTVNVPLTAVRGDTLVSDIAFSLAPPQLGNRP